VNKSDACGTGHNASQKQSLITHAMTLLIQQNSFAAQRLQRMQAAAAAGALF